MDSTGRPAARIGVAVVAMLVCLIGLGSPGASAAQSGAIYTGTGTDTAPLVDGGLTQPEASVSVLTAEGVPAPGIASHLHVALPTVYSYRARGLGKLGLHGRGQLLELLRREAGMR